MKKKYFGSDLTTIINKAIDNNKANEVQKDENNKYMDNHNNSIQIDIYFLDDDKIHKMEEFSDKGMNEFVQYYGQIKFKCTKKEYHQETNKLSYLYFEQITQ